MNDQRAKAKEALKQLRKINMDLERPIHEYIDYLELERAKTKAPDDSHCLQYFICNMLNNTIGATLPYHQLIYAIRLCMADDYNESYVVQTYQHLLDYEYLTVDDNLVRLADRGYRFLVVNEDNNWLCNGCKAVK